MKMSGKRIAKKIFNWDISHGHQRTNESLFYFNSCTFISNGSHCESQAIAVYIEKMVCALLGQKKRYGLY